MKISPELERQILARPDTVVRTGGAAMAIYNTPIAFRHKHVTNKAKLVEPSVDLIGGTFVAVIPAITRSEANEPRWVKKMRRKLSTKQAVRQTIGPYARLLWPLAEAYHQGKMLKVCMTRLGGRRLDECNLPSSMKVVEDMVAGALLADDGDPRWSPRWKQSPGGEIGVVVEIAVA